MLHTGYVITYVGCEVLWCSKSQMEITLITTESEYIVLSHDMRNMIPFMEMMKEVTFIFYIHLPSPEVFWKLFEDNQSCISVAELKFFYQEQNTSILSIIISEALYKRK